MVHPTQVTILSLPFDNWERFWEWFKDGAETKLSDFGVKKKHIDDSEMKRSLEVQKKFIEDNVKRRSQWHKRWKMHDRMH